MKLFKDNPTLPVVALVAIVNALGYGIIIPVLYAYSQKFGLTDFQNGILFAVYAICQFFSTPVIGRLSDKHGRKPLLLISVLGTALSFFMMAFAPSALFLFLARALDGITAGNLPVLSAIIADTTQEKDRARAFGIVMGSFSFGFIFGPAIAAFTVGMGAAMPFLIAGIIASIAVIVTYIVLPETNKHMGEVVHKSFFNFGKLVSALFDENVGMTLLITLFYSLAFSAAILFGFQPFALHVLGITSQENSILFTLFGVVGLVTQIFLLDRFTKYFGIKKAFTVSLLILALCFLAIFFTRSLIVFVVISLFMGFANSSTQPLIQAILSQETDVKSQGSIQGLNTSYMSIGQIFGPIIGGLLASITIPLPFLAGSLFMVVCIFLSFHVLKGHHKESAF